ncbi:NlpC/P60 family protein [Oscillospiraceae bacterium OttesenSCG-928-G22]|nr:NlpC/P60 family protein [Eubacteriales bacterium OttesenSCG-928-K08]MDL2273690.1 NlpC/P60 family protein [Oscillospiraceae bacterium OttesenSCG-928-G22]MDL2300068.1 NlpC/P60 family protein [Clostridiaceae bacterium OttesenSCG-928-D20]
MKEHKAPDKITQKMTRSGAVAENLTTGEAEPISTRPADENISEQPVNTAGKVLDRADAIHTRSSKKAARKANKTVSDGMEAAKRPSSRLQFTDEERGTPELQKAIRKSDKAADKLDVAREAVPKQKKLVRERVFDDVSGKGKTRLRFKETEKPLNTKAKLNPLSRPVQEVGAQLHGKIREVEHENVGVEGGHAVERVGEKVASKGYRLVKGGIRRHKLKPYRAAAKAEQSAIKANTNYLYQKALHDNPQLASNPLSRFMQKQQIKRSYAKRIKDTGKTAQKAGGAVKSAAVKAKEAAQKAAGFVRRHWKGLLALLALGLMVIFLIGGLQSCSSLFGGASSSIIASSYLSEDTDMLAAEAAYSALEAELQNEMDNIESVYPGYDEYRLDLDDIEHDPYVLISILSALHEGVFTIDEVQGDLAMLFDKQYILTVTEEVEVRYRTETDTWTDDEGNTHTDTYEVAYNYYILNVELENFNLSHVPVYIMSEETLGLYATYMSTLGNRPDLFPSGAYPNASTLKEPTYYDIPAEALEDETFAALIAEAEKYIGYPYVWGGSSPATSFDCSGFVSYVLTNSGLCNTGRLGAQGLYNISTPVSAANAKPGDLVFFVGTYDTPGVSHVGIYVGNGVMLHCGDPISYTSIETSYWQSHFYAFGRPPY